PFFFVGVQHGKPSKRSRTAIRLYHSRHQATMTAREVSPIPLPATRTPTLSGSRDGRWPVVWHSVCPFSPLKPPGVRLAFVRLTPPRSLLTKRRVAMPRVLLVALALLLSAAPASAQTAKALDLVPDDALGFILIKDLHQLSDKVEQLASKLK